MDEAWPAVHRSWSLRRAGLPVVIGGGIVVAIVLLAILAPWISPHDPLAQVLPDRLKPPAWLPGGSLTYLLGTDSNGRDLLSRILWGARTSLEIGVLSVLLGAAIGVTSSRNCWASARNAGSTTMASKAARRTATRSAGTAPETMNRRPSRSGAVRKS